MLDNNKHHWSLVLASSSPRRRELLGHLKIPFSVQVASIAETSEQTKPAEFVLDIARQKGEAILSQVEEKNVVVISADTIVCFENKIYGKPTSPQEAIETLKILSGQEHQVYTAVCVFKRFQMGAWQKHHLIEKTNVRFYPYQERLVKDYVKTGDCMDKAGAYGIQGQALTLIAGIDGCYANVMGFPVAQFARLMEDIMRPDLKGVPAWQDLFLS